MIRIALAVFMSASLTLAASAQTARWDGKPGSATWTTDTLAALAVHGAPLANTVPNDIATYCPAYASADNEKRRQFWTGLMSALVRHESNYNPRLTYTENFNDLSGRRVVSRGLLQISIESANGYGCGLSDAQELHDPKTNLTCGVRILSRLVSRHGTIATDRRPWNGAAAYWSPFRKVDKKRDMSGWTRGQAYCR